MFSQSAAYDRFMGRWSARLAPLFVEFARVAERDAILDVGSGTGSLSLAAAAAAPAGRVTGIDVSAAYVAAARTRSPGDRVQFEEGDAQALRFPSGSFDRTLSLLVINFIPDPARALVEMIRVTRPGGIVAAAVWDYDQGMEMLRVFWDEAVALDPVAEPRDERHMRFCRQGELADLWRQHGLIEIQARPLTVPLEFASFDDYWLPFLDGQGPAGAYAASRPEPRREQLRQRLRSRLLGEAPDRPITLHARAWAVLGVVGSR
jgi:ubiquinone/menaquinone biosynthesis C-methylase UbiE